MQLNYNILKSSIRTYQRARHGNTFIKSEHLQAGGSLLVPRSSELHYKSYANQNCNREPTQENVATKKPCLKSSFVVGGVVMWKFLHHVGHCL